MAKQVKKSKFYLRIKEVAEDLLQLGFRPITLDISSLTETEIKEFIKELESQNLRISTNSDQTKLMIS
jgi:hypothetical protein